MDATRPGPVPPGEPVDLGRRGTTYVRDVSGPSGAPTVLLLHGWIASGALNWFRVFEPLSRHFRVVAPDLRGHARGIRSRRVFRLADCADDTALTLLELETGPVIAVGYSMGGPVAQLLWRRHRDLIDGLVLAATGAAFVFGTRERVVYSSMMAGLAATTRLGIIAERLPGVPDFLGPISRGGRSPGWAADDFRRHNWRMIVEAGHSIGTYNAQPWIDEVDVPTTVLVTTRDRAVDPAVQRDLAARIPGADTFLVDDGHIACANPAFGDALLAAVQRVADRLARSAAP